VKGGGREKRGKIALTTSQLIRIKRRGGKRKGREFRERKERKKTIFFSFPAFRGRRKEKKKKKKHHVVSGQSGEERGGNLLSSTREEQEEKGERGKNMDYSLVILSPTRRGEEKLLKGEGERKRGREKRHRPLSLAEEKKRIFSQRRLGVGKSQHPRCEGGGEGGLKPQEGQGRKISGTTYWEEEEEEVQFNEEWKKNAKGSLISHPRGKKGGGRKKKKGGNHLPRGRERKEKSTESFFSSEKRESLCFIARGERERGGGGAFATLIRIPPRKEKEGGEKRENSRNLKRKKGRAGKEREGKKKRNPGCSGYFQGKEGGKRKLGFSQEKKRKGEGR